jgi:hypothetical protein
VPYTGLNVDAKAGFTLTALDAGPTGFMGKGGALEAGTIGLPAALEPVTTAWTTAEELGRGFQAAALSEL